jgi:hypothetical protein
MASIDSLSKNFHHYCRRNHAAFRARSSAVGHYPDLPQDIELESVQAIHCQQFELDQNASLCWDSKPGGAK